MKTVQTNGVYTTPKRTYRKRSYIVNEALKGSKYLTQAEVDMLRDKGFIDEPEASE